MMLAMGPEERDGRVGRDGRQDQDRPLERRRTSRARQGGAQPDGWKRSKVSEDDGRRDEGVTMAAGAEVGAARQGTQMVLLTLAAGQFLMTLDSSVMNVSIASVAKDVGTTVTGIQGAITLYTLVMAMFMVTGGKVGSIIGRKRAFAIGCVIYGAGSLTTALAPNLAILVLGWSLLEGIGAALIMPAIVA